MGSDSSKMSRLSSPAVPSAVAPFYKRPPTPVGGYRTTSSIRACATRARVQIYLWPKKH